MNEIPLTFQLQQLEMAAEECRTGDELREAEIKNIVTVIQTAGYSSLIAGKEKEVRDIITEMTSRINELMANPDWAGRHERHRPTIPAPMPDGCFEIEEVPKSGVRLIS